MTKSVVTVPLDTSMRQVQHVMKQRAITGVPVVEGKRLLGIVSMDDIVQALDEGCIEAPVADHMTRNLILLEEDMPVSFAISYFDRYRYHRFPVIDKEKNLVGIVTTRDITNRLLWEINHEIERIERIGYSSDTKDGIEHEVQTFTVMKHDFENAGFASTEIKKRLKQSHAYPKTIRRVAIAAYEMEMNIVVHSNGGQIVAEYGDDAITLTARDNGPGIVNIENAMQSGFSTANEWIRSLGFGAGMGLPNIQSVSDEFSIESSPQGSVITSIIRFLHIEREEGEKRDQ